MEESKANLSLDDNEEETIQLRVESSHRETSYANCFVEMFLTSSVVNFQAMRSMLENVLVEDGGDGSSNYENSTNVYGGRNLRRSQSIPVDQGANVGFPPKISYSLKGKSNISSIFSPTKVGELGQNNNKDKNNFDKDMAIWKNECKESFRSFSRTHIDIMMDEDSDGKNWRCTDFYGALKENLREAY
ncbi:hypothetical protein Goshw_024825 [Gossypium schwendimanii]|uniref:Uncharacterized protein n=1 Tax=Gossypium schwendimanii TaxID=34291 RepID=A0A7J9KUQ0_GOSSC|nr:hypothetical protein [Gossypium schwendimanii]